MNSTGNPAAAGATPAKAAATAPAAGSYASPAALLRRGLWLEYVTLGWNVVGCWIVLAAAGLARSVALAGFGLDSAIEIFASEIGRAHV